MDITQIRQLVADFGGTISSGINWTWAHFTDDKRGEECLEQLRSLDHTIEDRGYYTGHGFRFR